MGWHILFSERRATQPKAKVVASATAVHKKI